MRLITKRQDVLARLEAAGRQGTPLLCPNAETPEEMEGIMLGAQRFAASNPGTRVAVGLGFTATYPDHPQLGGLALGAVTELPELTRTAEIWLGWLAVYADRPGLFDDVEVIPFLDHGWVPHGVDLALMNETWFQDALGIIMHDASAFDFEDNVRLTRSFVERAAQRVVVEACPDKIYERRQIEEKGLRESDLLSKPEAVERFVRETGVDLIVPSLGTEHRTTGSEPLQYRRDLAKDIAGRVGPRMALHGTSSLGGRLGTVGGDGICKINYYTGMARGASMAVRKAWGKLPPEAPLPIGLACGSYLHRERREQIAADIAVVLSTLNPVARAGNLFQS